MLGRVLLGDSPDYGQMSRALSRSLHDSGPGHNLRTSGGRFARLFRSQACSEARENTAAVIAQIVPSPTSSNLRASARDRKRGQGSPDSGDVAGSGRFKPVRRVHNG